MPTMLDIACPNCKKVIKVPAEFVGKKVKCKNCEHPFAVQAPAEAKQTGAKPAAAPPAPPKKNRWDDDEDDEASKKAIEV
ncbi:MAG TPA: hypothetical protein VMZ71_04285, partial [Gemmataceae bacterium]|nr:hypothetical protein [Gemmataceae bacterium]